MDFEELREYIPGDDVRSIDWNVTARMRRPFVKNYREERELTTYLVVDVSASGEFGSRGQTKREFAAEVAATLATSALRNGDKVGLLLFKATGAWLSVPAKKWRQHLLRVNVPRVDRSSSRSRARTDIQRALAAILAITHDPPWRAIVFLITDFSAHLRRGASCSAAGGAMCTRKSGRPMCGTISSACTCTIRAKRSCRTARPAHAGGLSEDAATLSRGRCREQRRCARLMRRAVARQKLDRFSTKSLGGVRRGHAAPRRRAGISARQLQHFFERRRLPDERLALAARRPHRRTGRRST